MLEYIYKLNLPSLKNVINLNELEKIFINYQTTDRLHLSFEAEQLFKPEILTVNNIKFSKVSVFKKTNCVGDIHTDDYDNIKNENENPVWGINWVYNGISQMEYWSKSQISSYTLVPDDVGTHNTNCKSADVAEKIYLLANQHPYLVNTSIPHRATGFGHRYVFSLRTQTTNFKWIELVDKFKDLIIWSG
jgi:hypothetical protein